MLPFYITALMVWYILLLLYSPIPLAKLMARLGYRGLCRTQDVLSEMRRRLKYGRTNAHNPAARLPVELQVHVFSFVRSRAAFGRAERHLAYGAPDAGAVFWGCRDLAAARLVCRAWTDTATAVLYADVTLVSARACVAFASVLLAHPRQALLVRSMVFPPVSRFLATAPPGQYGWQKSVDGVRKMDLKAAVDRLAVQCTNATDVTFFPPGIPDVTLEEVPGLLQYAPRLEHLAFRHLDSRDMSSMPFPVQQLARFPRLSSLSLQMQHLVIRPATMPSALHTLRLGGCFITVASLRTLLGQLPNLRVLLLRDIELIHDEPLVPVTRLLEPAQAVLTECAIIGERHLAAPRSLDDFASLQRLTISACLLADSVQMLPPLLRELIVTKRTRYVTRVPPRKALFNAAQCLMRLPMWSAPSLSSVQLWDTALLSELPDYRIVAYMLSESLKPVGIAVAVNLFLGAEQERDVRGRFQRKNRIRRLLWQNVV